MRKKFVALDRDGTIIVEKNYLSSPEGVELLPGAAAGLRRLQAAGYGLVIVSNQSGIGRGYFTYAEYEKVTEHLLTILREEGVEFAGVYCCPHAPEEDCPCRKPRPGMLLQAAREHGFSLTDCVVIGDKSVDINLGKNAGAGRTVLVRTGYGAEAANACTPDAIADNLDSAADFIIG